MSSDAASPDEGAHRYSPMLARHLESKWQRWWAENGTFQVSNPVEDLGSGCSKSVRPKFYVLDMFPYPSGAGLHVGHPLGFIASDVYARFMRMQGYKVLHPFGFDAFGLPAEQYAIETGQHPAVTTQRNIDNMRSQLQRLGMAHDTRREISTADPAYYRWTQWIFLQIFNSWCDPDTGIARPIGDLIAELESGRRLPTSLANPDALPWSQLDSIGRRKVIDAYRLAYLEEAPVNWCPGLGTVLANEEVTSDGRSEVGNYPVYRRRMRQWMLRITAFADRLLADLDSLDWPQSLKTMQGNWIGRTNGAVIAFQSKTNSGDILEIEVFTTRPDTLFGATALLLAPESPLVDQLVSDAWPEGTLAGWRGTAGGAAGTPLEAVTSYRNEAASVSDRQRQTKAGKSAVFTGSYAVNPATGKHLPILVADYVLAHYGSGAVMAVPAHDQRDYELARAINLPMRSVVEPDAEWLATRSEATGDDATNWGEAFEGAGVAINSADVSLSLNGLPTERAKQAILDWLESTRHGRRRTAYRLRDWLFSRQRYWGEPFPIVYDETDMPIALFESMLPVELPPMTDFRPKPADHDEEDEQPRPPLSRAAGFEYADLDLGDGMRRYRRETNTMPQWAGSCWYYLRYLDPGNDRAFVDPANERFWMGNADGSPRAGGSDLYIGGVEHAVLHLLYARFWHKILYDLSYVSTPEPFQRLYNQGYILADAFTDTTGRYVPAAEVTETPSGPVYGGKLVQRHTGKMGKSLKNSVSPDDICETYGADTLRLYEMAMGPLDVDRPWQPDDIVGVYRFLQRLWRNLIDEETGCPRISEEAVDHSHPLYRAQHNIVAAVTSLFAELRYNVAIARIMELNNTVRQHVQEHDAAPRETAEALVLMTSPLAPHIAAELWQRLGHSEPIDKVAFPVADREALVQQVLVLPVTVDGKLRGEITVGAEAAESDVTTAALALDAVVRLLAVRELARVVFVPGKIVNVVTRPKA